MTNNVLYISDMPADVALNPQDHNYLKLIAAYVPKELIKQGVFSMHIAHDDSCEIYKQGNCNCHPDITVERLADHNVVFALRWNSAGAGNDAQPKDNLKSS